MSSEKELTTYVNKVYSHHLTNLRWTIQNDKDASLTALTQMYATFQHSPDALNLIIPVELWKRLDETMWKRINRLRKEICAEKTASATAKSHIPSVPIDNQYLTMNSSAPKNADIETAINAFYKYAELELSDDDNTGTIDDDIERFSINMVAVAHDDVPDDVPVITIDQDGLPVDTVQGADIVCDCTESFR